MFCKQCGSEIKEGHMFCEKCGMQVMEDSKSSDKGKKRKIIIVIIIAVIVLSIIGFATTDFDEMAKEFNDETITIEEVTSTNSEATDVSEPATEPTEVAEEIHQVGAIEELYESDEYLNEKVTVSGYVNLAGSMQDPLKMYGDYSSAEVLLQGTTGYDLPESEFMTVTGTVSKDEYGAVIIYVESFE